MKIIEKLKILVREFIFNNENKSYFPSNISIVKKSNRVVLFINNESSFSFYTVYFTIDEIFAHVSDIFAIKFGISMYIDDCNNDESKNTGYVYYDSILDFLSKKLILDLFKTNDLSLTFSMCRTKLDYVKLSNLSVKPLNGTLYLD